LRILLANEAATDWFAERLAGVLMPGVRIYLSGNLGAGKTRMTRGLLRGLGHTGRVRSPTFTLLEPYKLSRFELYHFDFYRFSGDNEWREAGFEELLSDPSAVCVVEWPEMAGSLLPAPHLGLKLATVDEPSAVDDEEPDTKRILEIDACGDWATAWLGQLSQQLARTRSAEIFSLPD
jgi:tRNA threonylcarbamoyladenosine biosynthesis protein TsaE